MIHRRAMLALLSSLPFSGASFAKGRSAPRILVRACWQAFSMGEVAQTVGMLRLLEQALPKVKLSLWATCLDHGVGEWLAKLFPDISILTGTVGRDGKPDQPELIAEWKRCSFLLHGPAGNVVARGHLEAWRKHTGKPFGIYGVTLGEVDEKLANLLQAAEFVFLRDGLSRALAARHGVKAERMGFTPDATFACTVGKSAVGTKWLKAHDLVDHPFICVVPKLRHTPYWEIYEREPKYAEIGQAAVNRDHREGDCQLLVQALTLFMGANDHKVVLCPEMPYQVSLARDGILAKLPEPLQKRCLLREETLLPDEAVAIFRQARLVLSMELLSAVVAATAETPALHLRLPNDTNKGQMWRDVGLKDWILEREGLRATVLAERMLEIAVDPESAMDKLQEAIRFIRTTELQSMEIVRSAIS